MVKLITTFFFILLVLNSCNEKQIESDWNISENVSINAIFYDSITTQMVQVTKNIPLEATQEFIPITDAIIKVTQAGNTYDFERKDKGIYESEIPFSLGHGENYTIHYEVDTATLTQELSTPLPVELIKVDVAEIDISFEVSVQVQSEKDQFVLLKAYEYAFDAITDDSLWVEVQTENSFNISKVTTGLSTISLSDFGYDFTVPFNENTTFKLQASVISDHTATYLLNINEFLKGVATTNLFVNYPNFYDNHFYGITYSTITSEINIYL
jgi:hypothetical protein